MFCTTCGSQIDDNLNFCTQCGSSLINEATPNDVTPVCEEAPAYVSPEVIDEAPAGAVSPKSRLTALLLAIFLGNLGINRFYLGSTGSGIPKVILCPICIILCFIPYVGLFTGLPGLTILGIFTIIDVIHTATGKMVDGDGLPVKNW